MGCWSGNPQPATPPPHHSTTSLRLLPLLDLHGLEELGQLVLVRLQRLARSRQLKEPRLPAAGEDDADHALLARGVLDVGHAGLAAGRLYFLDLLAQVR